jgi:hypothetical protein
MASKTKIGLLLGLVFIFVFSFIINGLSDLGNAGDSNESPVFDIEPSGIKPDIKPEHLAARRVSELHNEEATLPDDKEPFQDQLPEVTSHDKTEIYAEPVKQVWPKVHIVREGENLADIAKEYYGPKEGNRRANIKRIFQANSKLLDSPDKIYPGQQLIIPALWASAPDKNGIEGIFPDSMFEEVETIGRRHL